VPGADYFPPTISGPSQPTVNAANAYSCTAITNATGYQWLVAQSTNGNLSDGAENGLVNFTATTSPGYSVITNGLAASGSFSFHLAQPQAVDQTLQLKELLFPATNSSVAFKSLLGYSTSYQVAKVQVSTDYGTNWQDIYSQSGTGSSESSFTAHTLSLSNYAGEETLLRFNYHIDTSSGSFSLYTNTDVSPFAYGWFIDNIVITNISQLINLGTNSTASTNFTFTPTQTGNYDLFACAVIFTQFPLGLGPVKQVTAIAGPPVITLNTPVVSGGQVQLNFSVSGSASTFKLLQEDQINGTWITNSGAAFTTNVAGSSYRFTTTNGPATRFYRIQSP